MDEDYSVAFELIAYAGSSRSHSMEALQFARAGKLDEARASLKEADADLRLAHKTQTNLIQAEAGGNAVPINIILVHAQDHLSSATVILELASEFIYLYERMPAAAAAD